MAHGHALFLARSRMELAFRAMGGGLGDGSQTNKCRCDNELPISREVVSHKPNAKTRDFGKRRLRMGEKQIRRPIISNWQWRLLFF